MRVELICVGTELLTGKVSTHSAGLSERLRAAGLALARETVVGDDETEMAAVFREAWHRSDLVLCAGGLGPTFDDVTRDVWARVLKRPLLFRPALLKTIEARFRAHSIPMAPENRRQAFVLTGATPLNNPHGTAPGQRLAVGRRTLFLLPGPGTELFPMADAFLAPWLRRRAGGRRLETRVWRLFGVPESTVDERMKPALRAEADGLIWGILAQEGVVDIKASAAGTPTQRARRLGAVDRRLRDIFGMEIYGMGKEGLEDAVGKLLLGRKETLSAAESCTGGLLSERLTRVPGSSAYFIDARVTYADRAKTALLGVPAPLIRANGAVSRECAAAMAAGARRSAKTDWALSITGIAGPGGGSAAKPVGLVFIGLAGPGGVETWEHRFRGDRERVRRQSALWALERLRRALVGRKKGGDRVPASSIR